MRPPFRRRNARVTTLSGAAIVVAGLLTGCGGSAVDSSCAVDDLTHEVEHIVEEALLVVDSVDELQCSGEWAVITATISGEGTEPYAETMLFRKPADAWVLKTSELVCDPAAGDEAITGDLAERVCGAG
jgi:hypothetical protein